MNTTGRKFGGRAKGTANKTTNEIREHYQKLISNNLELLQNDLNELEPKERLKIILELSKFVVPTLKAIEMNTDSNDNFTPIIFEFSSNEKTS